MQQVPESIRVRYTQIVLQVLALHGHSKTIIICRVLKKIPGSILEKQFI